MDGGIMKRKILAVDDSKTMRDMVSLTLRNAGHDVAEAADGQQALTVLGSNRVDLVITDLNMPKMDGIALIKALRSHPVHRATPILILTTESDDAKKAEGKAAGATGWIVKPFEPQRLIEVVGKVCP
jgi:two-component system chemotaxis response regulator CheY